MKSKKQLVLDFLQNLPNSIYEQYNEAFSLYRRHEGKEFTAERTYNQGFSESNLKNLLYDLQKVYEITDLELLEKPVIQLEPVKQDLKSGDGSEDSNLEKKEPDPSINPDVANSEQNKMENLEVIGTEEVKADFIPAPSSEQRIALRDQFSFLKEADCPMELKALVTDKISAYENYCAAHNKLLKHTNGEVVLTDDELQIVTEDALGQFEANQAIFEELNHYAIHKNILGKHAIFRKLANEREVAAMTSDELFAYVNSSKKFFSVKKKAMEIALKANDKAKIAELNTAIEERNELLSLVKNRLNLKK